MNPPPTENDAPGDRPARSTGPVASPGPPPGPDERKQAEASAEASPGATPAAGGPSPPVSPEPKRRAGSPDDPEFLPRSETQPQPSAESSGRPDSNDRRMRPRSPETPAEVPAAPASISLLQRLKRWLDLVLVADVFLVIAAALWFALAVLLHSRGLEAPLRLFQTLWEPLFTPAIGLLMAAALLSGALGWWQRRGQR